MKIHRLAWMFAVGGMLAAGSTAALAQQQRTIEAPAGTPWRHAATGLVIPPALDGLPRTSIADNSAAELDVALQFGDPDKDPLSLYIFRPTLFSVPVWFDRAETQILARETYGRPTPHGEPVAFARPQAGIANALRRTYLPGAQPFRSTGLVMLPIGEWLVAVRYSSRTVDPETLDGKLMAVIAGLGWPSPVAGTAEAPLASAVQPCTDSLAFSPKAKQKKPDMTAALLGAAFAQVSSDPETRAKVSDDALPFCREGPPTPGLAAYRTAGDASGYRIAVGDAGQSIDVQPEILLDAGKPGYAVTFHDLATSYVFPAFNKMPDPARVLTMIQTTRPISSSARDGKNITIGAD